MPGRGVQLGNQFPFGLLLRSLLTESSTGPGREQHPTRGALPTPERSWRSSGGTRALIGTCWEAILQRDWVLPKHGEGG